MKHVSLAAKLESLKEQIQRDPLLLSWQPGPLWGPLEPVTDREPRRGYGSCAEAPGPLSGCFLHWEQSDTAVKSLN